MSTLEELARQSERARRLLSFVKAEIWDMKVDARFEIACGLYNYLEPEFTELLRKGLIRELKP